MSDERTSEPIGTGIVLHGGPLGGEVAEFSDPRIGAEFLFDDPTAAAGRRRRLVYEIRTEVDEDTGETRIFAAFTGTRI